MATTSQDLFAHTLNTEAHEIAALIRHLAQQPRDKRLDAVKGLRKAVKRSHNVLPSVTQNDFFRLLSALLHDDPHQRPHVTAECLWLVVDVIPFQYNVDHFLAPILAPVVAFLGKRFPTPAPFRSLSLPPRPQVTSRQTFGARLCVCFRFT
jgi:hypothetical protein